MNKNIKKPGYGLGVAGFVVGILGLLICWIPWVGIWPAFVGLILSAIAISIASRAEYSKGLIIAGLAISLVASIISGWITYKATTFIGDKFDNVKEEFKKEMEKEETKGSLFDMEDALEEMEDELKEAEEEINKAAKEIDADSDLDYDELIEEGDYDVILDDYEEMVDEYAELVKKSEDGDLSAVGSYMKIATKLSVMSMKMVSVMPKLSEEQKERLDEINNKYEDMQ